MTDPTQSQPEPTQPIDDSRRDRDNLAWFWKRYLKEKAWWMGLILLLLIAQGFVYQQFLRLTEDGLRVIFAQGAARDLVWICATVFGVLMFRGFMSYITPRLSAWIAADAIMKLRSDLTDHLMALDLAYFDTTRPGENILRLTNQAETLNGLLGQSIVRAGRDLFTVVILSIYLFWKQPILFSAAAISLPMIIFAMQFISRRIRRFQKQNQEALKDYVSALEETLGGMRTVKITGQESIERDRLKGIAKQLRRKAIDVQATNAMAMPFVDFAAAIVYSLVIGGGGFMVISPNYDVDGAAIIAFLIGLVLVFDPGRRLALFVAGIQSNFVILDVVRDMFRNHATVTDRDDAREAFNPSTDISLKGLSFAYSSDQPLFENLDMTLEGGKTTAIVGPTGSGKTTVLSLLGRLYDPTEGCVQIGGVDIRDIKIRSLRSVFAVVAQDIVIFDNSIWENIRYVRPDASEAEIWAAAEAADIADLIRSRGDTHVGPKGAQLSGGQRQRIAIARAFLKDAPIVLLDEATSALDQATESKIQEALARLNQGRTMIIIAHKLKSIRHADQIFVLESGKVVEQGSHDALLKSGGLYAQLYSAQQT